MRSKIRRCLYALILVLAFLQGIVFIGSWLFTAVNPDATLRSLLSDSGIRWFFGSFIANEARPLLVYIVLLVIGVGSMAGSGLWDTMRRVWQSGRKALDAQETYALRTSLVLVMAELCVLALLTLPPHAILLSVTGSLFPSSFSASIAGIVAFMMLSASLTFGLASGFIRGCEGLGKCLCYGSRWIMPILVLYVIAVELYCSIQYIVN